MKGKGKAFHTMITIIRYEYCYNRVIQNETDQNNTKISPIIICEEKLLQMRTILTAIITLFVSQAIFGQHEHHQQAPADTARVKKAPAKKRTSTVKTSRPQARKDTVRMDHSQHQGHDMEAMKPMPSHAYSRNLPMSRNGSGTGWNPDASPMYMWMKQTGKTDWMFHGNIFMRYTNTDIFNNGSRGANRFSFPNWFMMMMNHKAGEKGLLNATVMLSLDRLTEGGNGYPLLFQSGETYNGKKLVDRQHPHDLFSALSVGYTHMFNKDIDLFGYIGYPGEPALGATAFMHRVSAMNDPDAPLGHHWQDATHITFGVATLGFRYRNFKLEGSAFTGREPDEERFDFDKPRFDSYSYRVSFNPTANWALQFSQGFIREPEALEPGVDLTRTTASALFVKPLDAGRHLSGALVWGLNDKGDDHQEHSVLAEANYQFRKNAVFSRYEFIQKSTEELDLEGELGHHLFNVNTFSFGYNRIIWQDKNIDLTAGTKATLNFPATMLKPLYGNMPVGFQVYLQLRPSLHSHKH